MGGRLAMVALITALLPACGNAAPEQSAATPRATAAASSTAGSSASYDGVEYAGQVQQAILDSFAVESFAAACPQPDWVCAIGSIESTRPWTIDVTLQPGWEAAFGEWTGPPAGVGCLKWGQQVRRNIENFATAAGVDAPRQISVFEPDGRNC